MTPSKQFFKIFSGVSGKSQIMFAIVFTTRYLDLFTNFISLYNTCMKVFFIASSFFTVFLMYHKFRATYDANHDTFRMEFLIVPVGGLSFLVNHDFSPLEVLIILIEQNIIMFIERKTIMKSQKIATVSRLFSHNEQFSLTSMLMLITSGGDNKPIFMNCGTSKKLHFLQSTVHSFICLRYRFFGHSQSTWRRSLFCLSCL